MRRLPIMICLAVGAALAAYAARADAQVQKISACSLLTREEVKEVVPWPPLLDQLESEEDVLPNGSGCNYPNTYIQVLSASAWESFVDVFGKDATSEPVAGIGDEAYIRDNQHMWAELCAKVGTHVLTIQHDLNDGETTQAAKPRVIALAKLAAARLK